MTRRAIRRRLAALDQQRRDATRQWWIMRLTWPELSSLCRNVIEPEYTRLTRLLQSARRRDAQEVQ
jgi:hypothetical protein